MSCWSVLGISHEADARTIKRQYAALLKRYRPDEDPEGFQRLREAYEQALDWANTRQDDTIDRSADSVSLLVPLPEPAPAASPTPARQLAAQLANTQQDGTVDITINSAPLLVPLPDPIPAAGPTPAWQLAERLADGLDADCFDDRLEQAQRYACAREFEDIVLHHCQAFNIGNARLTEQVTNHFHWLTPWQSDHLSREALQNVLRNLKGYAQTGMAESLRGADTQSFLDLCQHLGKQSWLQSLDNAQWLHDSIAQTLLESSFWSDELFEALSNQLGWKQPNPPLRCADRYWSQLLARKHRSIFLAEQQRIANQKSDSSARRAARFLFLPATEDERMKMAAHFNTEDWALCEKLVQTAQQFYPELLVELPGLAPRTWRPLHRNPPVVPLVLAILSASTFIAYRDFYRLGGNLYDTLLIWGLIAIVLGTFGWLLSRFCRSLGLGHWRLDTRLQERYGHWLSLRRPPPLPIRESLPSGLLGGLLYLVQGLGPLLVYSTILVVMALLSRTRHLQLAVQWLTGPPASVRRDVWLGIAIGLAASLITVMTVSANYRPVPPGYGLQAWPERLCAAQAETDTPCRPPQWYPPQQREQP
ncbi:hypothetical protein NS2R_01190 [Pseudomonas oryzihabitans]|nr:hypothetical protein NS2R_01190 [Pseudomonas psychrotolerans]